MYNESCTHLHKNENPFGNINFNFCELIQFFELNSSQGWNVKIFPGTCVYIYINNNRREIIHPMI